MTSETAKNLVSIASALIRMEEGMGKKKAESTRQRNVSKICPQLFPHQLQLLLKGIWFP